ncbi:MAG: Flp pilus assembly complex ATPase component TadA [Deltaproteobacteria bacterium]|nr:Flp pilus assembly complex ATPase component TadA [Deltaproteobacteria bacterium]
MTADAIIEKTDGQMQRIVLIRPFKPGDKEIIFRPENSEDAFALSTSELCCLHMVPKDKTFSRVQHVPEEIVTVTERAYHVKPIPTEKYPAGFYALSLDATTPFNVIFFMNQGVVTRSQKRRLGEILEGEGYISHTTIDNTLNEQKKIRNRKLGEIISEQANVPQETIENIIEKAYVAGKVTPRMRIGDILINADIISPTQLEEALASQERGKKIRLGSLLIRQGLITEEQLLMVLALKFHLPYVDLNDVIPTPEALAAIPADIVHALHVLPLEDKGKQIIVATSEPTDYTIPDSLYFHTKRRVEMVVATSRSISAAIQKYYPKGEYPEEIICGMDEEAQALEIEDDMESLSEWNDLIITLVDDLLLDAHSKGASDIHFEPGAAGKPLQIRYRIDGVCRVVRQVPKAYKKAVIIRLKIMANLDVSERRHTQNGRFIIPQKGRPIEYRLETVPTVEANEDAVVRIISTAAPRPLKKIDFTAAYLEKMEHLLSQPYGLILCVGPSGSGRTTTLHAALNYLNTSERKIWTVEDPVQIRQAGLRQVQVHPQSGFTDHEALCSCLMSDPDVIMIGEMKDAETVKTAIEASLTDHLVLGTLHANSGAEAVVRLIDLGVDPAKLADGLLGILAQRLVRRLCGACKKPYKPSSDDIDQLARLYGPRWKGDQTNLETDQDAQLMKKVGCNLCDNTGYKGRIAVHELFMNNNKLKRMIRQKASVDELANLASADGMKTLLMDGIQKIINGETDVDELLKVCRYDHVVIG